MHRSTRAIKVLLDPDGPSSAGPRDEGGAFFALGLTGLSFPFPFFSLSLLCRQPPTESAAEQFQPRPRTKQVSPSVSFHLHPGNHRPQFRDQRFVLGPRLEILSSFRRVLFVCCERPDSVPRVQQEASSWLPFSFSFSSTLVPAP